MEIIDQSLTSDHLRNHYTIDGSEFSGVLLSVMAAQSSTGAALLIAGATVVWYASRRANWWVDWVMADADANPRSLPLANRLLLPGPIRADVRDHGALPVREALIAERAGGSSTGDLWSLFRAVAHEGATDVESAPSPITRTPVPAGGRTLDAPTLGMPITLSMLATADNVLVVGPKGSGKTTLLQQLIRLRRGYHCALDPHNAPGKWRCDVRGGGMAFNAIDQRLHSTFQQMVRRYQALDRGETTEDAFQRARITLVGDEWGAISDELPPTKERLGAGQILKKLLAQGRKAAICVVAAAHSDTADSLRMHGNMALMHCFDYVVYLGAAATSTLKIPSPARRAAAQMTRPALVFDTERGTYHQLTHDVQVSLPIITPTPHRQAPPVDSGQALLESFLLSDLPGNDSQNDAERRFDPLPTDRSAFQRDGDDLPNGVQPRSTVSETIVSVAEAAQIAVLLAQGNAPSSVAKQLPGYAAKRYSQYRAKVDVVLAAMSEQASSSEQGADQEVYTKTVNKEREHQ